MEKNKYRILKKYVPNVKLNSINGGYWYNEDDDLISWSDDDKLIPPIGYIIKNTNDIDGLILDGYYRWDGSIWNYVNIWNYEDYNIFNVKLPIFLTETIDDLGIMSDFDGNVEQIEEKFNFLYTGETQSYTITVYNSVNVNKFRFLKDSLFKIEWGDGNWDMLDVTSNGSEIPSVSHTYSTYGEYTITLTKTSDWDKQIVKKTIKIPYAEITLHNKLSLENNEYRKLTGYTNGVEITGETVSRLDELRKYGENDNYSSLTITSEYTGYSFTYSGITGNTTTVRYRDYIDGKTIVFIPEDRSSFFIDELYNGRITRNEHFIGFVEEPTVYSDIFVERGKLGVMERNFRLSEIESTGELEIYGNGFFNVRKQ